MEATASYCHGAFAVSVTPPTEAELRRLLKVLRQQVRELDKDGVRTQEANELRKLHALAQAVLAANR